MDARLGIPPSSCKSIRINILEKIECSLLAFLLRIVPLAEGLEWKFSIHIVSGIRRILLTG